MGATDNNLNEACENNISGFSGHAQNKNAHSFPDNPVENAQLSTTNDDAEHTDAQPLITFDGFCWFGGKKRSIPSQRQIAIVPSSKCTFSFCPFWRIKAGALCVVRTSRLNLLTISTPLCIWLGCLRLTNLLT